MATENSSKSEEYGLESCFKAVWRAMNDKVWNSNSFPAGQVGMIARDGSGSIIAARALSLNGCFEVRVVEAMGVREALSQVKQ
ncbi:conserved hypothetical protein [Ricinus communis]|uniref:Uncharacterized protein n=1 Tax=Ricinus communis TaxID=3988 RepID=B9SDI9_RICCO|nr:conserved hypothetical protein [Ricinus communis]